MNYKDEKQSGLAQNPQSTLHQPNPSSKFSQHLQKMEKQDQMLLNKIAERF